MSASRPNPAPGDQVVLLAAIRAARRAGAGLEHRDSAGVAFLAQPLAGVLQQTFQDPLARLVTHDQVRHAAALRRRVLGAAGYVQVQSAAVPEQHVGGLAPGRDRAEQAASRLLRGQLPLPASGEDDAVGVPEPEDARVHKAKARRAAPRRLPVRYWRQAGQTRNTAPFPPPSVACTPLEIRGARTHSGRASMPSGRSVYTVGVFTDGHGRAALAACSGLTCTAEWDVASPHEGSEAWWFHGGGRPGRSGRYARQGRCAWCAALS